MATRERFGEHPCWVVGGVHSAEGTYTIKVLPGWRGLGGHGQADTAVAAWAVPEPSGGLEPGGG